MAAADRDHFDWIVPLGSAETLELTWTGEDGEPIDLTGWTAEVFDASVAIQGSVRATIPSAAAAAGRIDLRLDALPNLRAGIPQPFRVALRPPGPATALDARALPLFRVVPR